MPAISDEAILEAWGGARGVSRQYLATVAEQIREAVEMAGEQPATVRPWRKRPALRQRSRSSNGSEATWPGRSAKGTTAGQSPAATDCAWTWRL